MPYCQTLRIALILSEQHKFQNHEKISNNSIGINPTGF